jgi:hypothetical protein
MPLFRAVRSVARAISFLTFSASLKLDVLAIDFVEFDANVTPQHAHQRVDFITRSLPVFGGKGVQRQSTQTHTRASINGGAHRFDTSLVTCDSRMASLRGPTAVPVHDDRDVPRQTIPGNCAEERFVARSCLYYATEVGEHTRTRLLIIITSAVNVY